jgi:2-hydroxychromene-2-carboxylate isomerase
MQVQFVLDYRSPYAYLANTQIASLGAQVSYEPVDILSVMKEVNNQPSPMCPPKAKYAGLDATRWAKHYGVPFSPNMALLAALRQGDLENDLLSRAGIAGQLLGVFQQTNDALFSAVWSGVDDLSTGRDGRNLSQAALSRRNCGTLRTLPRSKGNSPSTVKTLSHAAYSAYQPSSSTMKCSLATID